MPLEEITGNSGLDPHLGMAASKYWCHHLHHMKKATQRIAWGVVRGTVAALAMTGGLRQATTGLGFVEQQRAVREEGVS